MFNGSCQCGAVRYEIRGPVRDVIACHCRDCRKMSGHYFAATAASWNDVNILDTEDLGWYLSSETSRRGFCRNCGSSLFFDHGRDNPLGIAAGSLENASRLKIAVHIYVDEKGDYYEIRDEAPHMDSREWRETGWDFVQWIHPKD